MSQRKAANRCDDDPRESTQLYACKTPHLAPVLRPSLGRSTELGGGRWVPQTGRNQITGSNRTLV